MDINHTFQGNLGVEEDDVLVRVEEAHRTRRLDQDMLGSDESASGVPQLLGFERPAVSDLGENGGEPNVLLSNHLTQREIGEVVRLYFEAQELVVVPRTLIDFTGGDGRQLTMITTHDEIEPPEWGLDLSQPAVNSVEHVGENHANFADDGTLYVHESRPKRIEVIIAEVSVVAPVQFEGSMPACFSDGDCSLSGSSAHHLSVVGAIATSVVVPVVHAHDEEENQCLSVNRRAREEHKDWLGAGRGDAVNHLADHLVLLGVGHAHHCA